MVKRRILDQNVFSARRAWLHRHRIVTVADVDVVDPYVRGAAARIDAVRVVRLHQLACLWIFVPR